MRVVLDTNVLISAIFFGGVPGRILDLRRSGKVKLVVSVDILSEYVRTADELASERKVENVRDAIGELVADAEIVVAPASSEQICRDPADDMFIACALAARCAIVTGDKDLLALAGHVGLRIVRPAELLREIAP